MMNKALIPITASPTTCPSRNRKETFSALAGSTAGHLCRPYIDAVAIRIPIKPAVAENWHNLETATNQDDFRW